MVRFSCHLIIITKYKFGNNYQDQTKEMHGTAMRPDNDVLVSSVQERGTYEDRQLYQFSSWSKPVVSDFSGFFPGLLSGISAFSVLFRWEAALICYSISMAFIFVVVSPSL
jgi:hypothetical protein